MSRHVIASSRAPEAERGASGKIVLGAVVGAVVGWLGTTVALGSVEAGIMGAVGGALFVMLGALGRFERSDG